MHSAICIHHRSDVTTIRKDLHKAYRGGGGFEVSQFSVGNFAFQIGCESAHMKSRRLCESLLHVHCMFTSPPISFNPCLMERIWSVKLQKINGGLIGMLNRQGQQPNCTILRDSPNASCSTGLHVHLNLRCVTWGQILHSRASLHP